MERSICSNAAGGAVNVHGNAPTGDPGGDITLTAGDYARLGVKCS